MDLVLNTGSDLRLRRDLDIILTGILLPDVFISPIKPRLFGFELILLYFLLSLLLDILKNHNLIPDFFDLVIRRYLADLN